MSELQTWISDVQRQMSRLGEGFEATRSVLAESIGNRLWHAEDPASTEWFEQALDLRAKVVPHRGPRSAFLYWKLGAKQALAGECREMRAREPVPMQALRSMARERPRDAARVAQTFVTSYLLAEDPEAVRLWAGVSIEAGIEPEPHGLHACSELANASVSGEGDRLNRALVILHGHFPTWPMYEPDWVRDLFRFALAFREARFPDLPLPFEGG